MPDNKPPQITYLLGAGASANVIPVYQNFNEGFVQFINRLTAFATTHQPTIQMKETLSTIRDEIKKVRTPDVYAHILYRRTKNQQNTDQEMQLELKYRLYKVALAAYLMAQQDGEVKKAVIQRRKEDDLNSDYLDTDPRYFEFLNEALHRKGLKENINILSWNYDMQLEKAYMFNFGTGWEGAHKGLRQFPVPRQKETKPYKFIKLNGTAGFYSKQDDKCTEAPILAFDLDSKEAFYNLVWDTLEDVQNRAENPNINFAFEYEKILSDVCTQQKGYHLCLAQKIIAQTDMLVIIGYSFQQPNLAIDQFIFEKSDKIKRVYIQCPEHDFDEIAYRLKLVQPRFNRLMAQGKDWAADKLYKHSGKENPDKHLLRDRIYHHKNLNFFMPPSQVASIYESEKLLLYCYKD